MSDQSLVIKSKYPFWKKLLLILISSLLTAAVFIYIIRSDSIISPIGDAILQYTKKEKPLEKYSFENLANTQFLPTPINIEKVLFESDSYTAYLFSIQVEGQKVTGQLNIPINTPPKGGFPVVVMNRGFIDPEIFQTGMGTKNAAGYFANQGFVTIAPDFLGFGGSDLEDVNPMAARVKKPVTTLTIIHSLENLNKHTDINLNHIFMWGHSNGGQISFSVLEILGKSVDWDQSIPTTLWAPVSKGFPYNILYYTDDGDYGKALRKVLFEFELDYDTDKYSIHKYFDWINSPIQIHQGTSDEWIPTKWSQDVVSQLGELEKDVDIYIYSNADHNLQPQWSQVVARDIQFFNSYIE